MPGGRGGWSGGCVRCAGATGGVLAVAAGTTPAASAVLAVSGGVLAVIAGVVATAAVVADSLREDAGGRVGSAAAVMGLSQRADSWGGVRRGWGGSFRRRSAGCIRCAGSFRGGGDSRRSGRYRYDLSLRKCAGSGNGSSRIRRCCGGSFRRRADGRNGCSSSGRRAVFGDHVQFGDHKLLTAAELAPLALCPLRVT